MLVCTHDCKTRTTFAEVTQQSVAHLYRKAGLITIPRNTFKITGQQEFQINKIFISFQKSLPFFQILLLLSYYVTNFGKNGPHLQKLNKIKPIRPNFGGPTVP